MSVSEPFIRRPIATSLLGVALMIGGALGNIVDRLRIGAVVDFLDLHAGGWHWPSFNLADVALFLGVALMLFRGFRRTHAHAGR